MVAFLRWSRTIALSALNSIAKFVLFLVLAVIVLVVIGLLQGDGLPSKDIVLSLDMRKDMPDSAQGSPLFGSSPLTVMNVVLALDEAARDKRVKGVFMRVGSGATSSAQAEELGAALKRFRAAGKFVIAHSQGFMSAGMGDYLLATAADEIWMQPKSPFAVSGAASGGIFVRGFLEKIGAEPQIAKRSDYKSFGDMFMEKSMTPADREQITALLQSVYGSVTTQVAAARKLTQAAVIAAFEKSPQFTEEAKAARLIDRIGFDDDAYDAAKARTGDSDAKRVTMSDYIKAKSDKWRRGANARIALIQASGGIADGSVKPDMLGGGDGIGGDDLARAIRQATADSNIKAIILRIDSPGGSVAASDQILDAVKKARAKGKPVVVSMGSVAASGGYYVSAYADKIVALPGTITGSIGVVTGKITFKKSLEMLGIGAEMVNAGKNAGMDSPIMPYTPEQWAAVNHEADVIYDDFTRKVAGGRKLPLAKVQEIAKGRIWSGTDAKAHGLVDTLGGFWTAASIVRPMAGLAPTDAMTFKIFPREKSFFEALDEAITGSSDNADAFQGLVTLLKSPFVKTLTGAVNDMPRDRIELRATNLPD